MLTDFFHNTHIPTVLNNALPTRAPLEFHRKLPGYAPTPLLSVPALAEALNIGHVLVKNEASRLGMPAFKILGASWATCRALAERLGGEMPPWETLAEFAAHLEPLRPLTLATATDGNHGRAVARMAALLSLEAHIFVPAGTAAARIQAIEGEGATVTVVDGSYDDAVRLAAQQAGPHCLVISDTAWPGYEQVPTWVIEGYSTIFWEIDDELTRRGEPGPDVVLVQSGVGALAAAVVRHYRRPDSPTRSLLVNVEPATAACILASVAVGEIVTVPGPHYSVMAGLNCGTPSLVAWPLLSQGIDMFLAIDDEQALQAMRDLAGVGIVAGETGAAGYAGLTALLTGPDAHERRGLPGITMATRALVIVTEGATNPDLYRQVVGQ